MPIVVDALGTATKESENRLEELGIGRRIETILTTALLRSARIPWRVPRPEEISNSSKRPPANTGGENPQWIKW